MLSLAFEERLAFLVDREFTSRHERRIQRRIKLANFPQSAPIEDLDLSAGHGLNRRLTLELTQSTWIANHLNTIVLGPTGSGKTFLSSALGLAACRNNFSVRYFRTSRLLFQLALSQQDGSFPAYLASLAKTDLLILDDCYSRSATLVASQVPVSDWFARFPDPTVGDGILDWIIHNAYRINLESDSQRKTRVDCPHAVHLIYNVSTSVPLPLLDDIIPESLDSFTGICTSLSYPLWNPLLAGNVTVEYLFGYIKRHCDSHVEQVKKAIQTQ